MTHGFRLDDTTGRYTTERAVSPDEIVATAKKLITKRFNRKFDVLSSPEMTRDFLILHLAPAEQEIFAVIFMDNRHRVIAYEPMFYGTIDGTSVHPREIAKRALQHNAAAIIVAHNHPSGEPEPSQSDRNLTRRLVDTLALLDIRVLDHHVIGGETTISFAERGWI